MYKRNLERLNRIKNLRRQNLTIDQIAAKTGDPRSTVGYYVTKYCGGRIRTRNPSTALSVQPETPQVIRVKSDSKEDCVEEYMHHLQFKDGLSVNDIVEGKRQTKRPTEPVLLQLIISDMFVNKPETLHVQLLLLEKLIRLAPFFRIDLDSTRDRILYLLSPAEKRKG